MKRKSSLVLDIHEIMTVIIISQTSYVSQSHPDFPEFQAKIYHHENESFPSFKVVVIDLDTLSFGHPGKL